ncbi:MAG: cytochrome P450 [Acidimicrobiales bacterium]
MATTYASPSGLSIEDVEFWRRPLSVRMADFAGLREQGAIIPGRIPDTEFGPGTSFYSVIRHAELCEISRKPQIFCSGRGSTALQDLPMEAVEYFGSFIAMDDPRHARQRLVVGSAFTPRRLATLVDSVEKICSELIDEMCEMGEVDLVQALSEPFPLLVICDMMGIPRSEFKTVLEATSVILGAGDSEVLQGRDPFTALLEAGATLTALMDELAAARQKNPTDDLTSALVHAEVDGQRLAPEELGPFFILLAVAGNDTTRTATSMGMHILGEHPDQRKIWQDDIEGVSSTAVDEIVRYASPVVFMRRTATEPVVIDDEQYQEGDKFILFYGAANRDPLVFDDPERFDVRRSPNPHVGFGGPGPHFCLGAHLARRELGIAFRQLFERVPDIHPVSEPDYLVPGFGFPLVSGVKHLRVEFTPTAPVGKT